MDATPSRRPKPARHLSKYTRLSASHLHRVGLSGAEPSSTSPTKLLRPSQPGSASRMSALLNRSAAIARPARSQTPKTSLLRLVPSTSSTSPTKKRLVSRQIQSGASVILPRTAAETEASEQSTEDEDMNASTPCAPPPHLVKRTLSDEGVPPVQQLLETPSFPADVKVKKFRRCKTDEDRTEPAADRFISQLCPDLSQRFSTKMHIYSAENPLWGETQDSPPPERPPSDENLKTYTALLQNQLFGIKNPYVLGRHLNVGEILDNSAHYIDENAGFHQFNVLKLRRSPLIPKPSHTYSLGPTLGFDADDLLPPCKQQRKISKVPYKVLDAPALQDDFYLNLVDWSDRNSLAVGLGSCIYLWSASSSKVTKLYDLGSNDSVTAVAWSKRGTHLAVGTNSGVVQIWDTNKCKLVRTMLGHQSRVGALNWSEGTLLCSGSRDKQILYRDIRNMRNYLARLVGHKQEICGLKWSFDSQQLASGGNDNKLHLWSIHNFNHPVHKFSAHKAAVKALAWSPHQHGLLASGGGTADRCIRFWNTLTGTQLDCVETGSQVCNLLFSKNINELTSTHGYSQNQIVLWKYPEMKKTATLLGHTCRVLYLAISPDGQTIVTGAGDETLRFWNVYPKKQESAPCASLIMPSCSDLR